MVFTSLVRVSHAHINIHIDIHLDIDIHIDIHIYT